MGLASCGKDCQAAMPQWRDMQIQAAMVPQKPAPGIGQVAYSASYQWRRNTIEIATARSLAEADAGGQDGFRG